MAKRKPRFKENDVVFWGNGVYELFFVHTVQPLHCPDGSFAYTLSKVHPKFRQYTSRLDLYPDVSEEVLRLVPGPIEKAHD